MMVAVVLAALVVMALPGHSKVGGDLRIERVFGPEVRTGPYKHPASIAQLANGDLFLVYYGGEGEYAIDTGVFGSRLKAGASHWTYPRRIAHDPLRSVGNGVIWQAPDSAVWLFYVVRWGETWSTSRIQAKISYDFGETWSDSTVISEEEGSLVRGHPIVLENGEYLLPIYKETGHDPEVVGAESTSRFLRFSPRTRKWVPSGQIHSAKGNIQPAVVQLSDKHLVAYCRRGGGYTPTTNGYIVRGESFDGGHTWSEGQDTQFPNPNAAVDLIRLRNGHLVLIYNNNMNDRFPLTVALSVDGEKTWPYRRDLAVGNFDYAYPFGFQADDGKIHAVYTSHGRTIVHHAVFDEAWIKAANAAQTESK